MSYLNQYMMIAAFKFLFDRKTKKANPSKKQTPKKKSLLLLITKETTSFKNKISGLLFIMSNFNIPQYNAIAVR